MMTNANSMLCVEYYDKQIYIRIKQPSLSFLPPVTAESISDSFDICGNEFVATVANAGDAIRKEILVEVILIFSVGSWFTVC